MKIFLLVALLLLGFRSAYTQPYQSIFGNTSTSWIFQWSNLPGTSRDSAFIEKDTIVNGLAYKKVITPGVGFFHGALLREDVNTGFVYYKGLFPYTSQKPSISDTEEVVLFRYDLNVGDTFNTDMFISLQPTGVADTVDSVKIIDGRRYIYFRKQIWHGEPFTMIEGIGSNLGVLCKKTATTINMQGQYLLCSYKDGMQTSFRNKRYNGECKPYLSVNNVVDEKKVLIYPIPAKNDLIITNNSSTKIKTITIVTVDGRMIKEVKDNLNGIDISAIQNGLYFIRLVFTDNSTLIQPISVNK